jgi:hypothetical protein
MVSGWSIYEKLTCLYYIKNNKAFILTNNFKISFFIATEGFFQLITRIERTFFR